jgi:tripartite-type tricarboxylate transporter receptor subunit TctC
MKAPLISLLFAFTLALGCGEPVAQTYPSKPIKLVVGFPPGASPDFLARLMGPKLSERVGQPVIVENKPGADSVIATEYVAKSAPDGYTLFLAGAGGMVFNTGLYANLPYDTVRDFIPITLFASDQIVFAVHPSVPAATMADLVALAKSKPGQLFYGSGAPMFQVAGELFKKQAGVNIVHVPFKGSAQTISANMAGEVPLIVTSTVSALTQLRAGKIRALAITGLKRAPILPDIPTVLESSGLDFEGVWWMGVFAPAATPRAIIDRLYGELSVVLKSDSVKERLAVLGYETNGIGMPPTEFEVFFRANLAKWTKAMKDLNIRTE